MKEILDRLQSGLEGHYRLERELGRGGAGIVFLAHDVKHGRKVAVKVLDPDLGQSLAADRFLREIRIAAQLNHPHILSMHDSGEVEGLLYYVMPFVDGESLQVRLEREHQLPLDEAVRIGLEVADALSHAHAMGLVHRDIKPANILLQSGHAVVCDFGIARAIGEAGGDKLTATGLTLGTPTYMSPEQALGDDVDHRTDIYSLGCVIYEMLAGGAPHAGPTPRVILARKLTESVPRLSLVRDTVPAHVEHAVARAMAKTPADRFQSAADLGEELSGRRSEGPIRTTRRWVRRVPLPLPITLAVVIVSLMGVWIVAGGRLPGAGTSGSSAPLRTDFTPLTTQPGVEDSPSLSPDGMWVVYAGDVEGNRDIYLQGVGGRLPINLTLDSPADDYQPAFSADGERIAFRSSRDGGGLFIMGRTGEAVRRVTRTGFNPSWSPDGREIAFATEGVGLMPLNWEGNSELRIADVESGETRLLNEGSAVQPAWSPDGRWVAYTARRRDPTRMDIWLQPAGGGDPLPVTTLESNDWSPAWSRDGRWLFFVSDRGGTMNLWRVAMDQSSGRPIAAVEPITTPGSFVAHPTVSGDGSLVAYSSVLHTQNIEMAALDWVGGRMDRSVPLTTGSGRWANPDPSPDGSLVVFYSQDLPEGDIYVVRGDGTGLRQVTADSAIDRVPRFSPDASDIAYFSTRSGNFQLWGTHPDGSGNRQISFARQTAWIATWAPDGRRIAVNGRADADQTEVFIYELDSPWDDETILRLPEPDSSVTRFVVNDWSPDGAYLAGQNELSDEGVLIYSLEGGRYERLTDFGQWPVWLPDSRHILFVTANGSEFHLVDRVTKETRLVYASPRDILGPPRVTDDGRQVVFSRRSSEGDIWLVRLR
ncbi:MAG: protein kinase [Longimicrobiales bacterium]|nr:protein kinase [Longimicrobiales bacterium]